MKKFTIVFLAASVWAAPAFSAQQQSPGGNSQNSQDVPHQQPGTDNPDLGEQRQAVPSPSKGKSQHGADVPHDQPGTSNPDVGKQRQPTPKKKKHKKSTAGSSQT